MAFSSPPVLPPRILLRILHSSTPSFPTISTLTHLWLSLRPVCRLFRREIEDVFLRRYLKDFEIWVGVYSQDIYQICDPTNRLPSSKNRETEVHAARPSPSDILFTFSHTTTTTTSSSNSNNNSTAIFQPLLPYSSDEPTAIALANLSSRFISRLMVKKPTHVVCWYGCVNDVFLPGLRVDLVRGRVEVEWRALVGGFLGEEKGVEGVRRGMVGGREASRGLCEMGGRNVRGSGKMVEERVDKGTRVKAGSAVHESPTTRLPMTKKKRRNGGKDSDGGRRRYARGEVKGYLRNQSASVSPVVIDLDPIQTPPSLERVVDMDLNLDLLSEVDWQHIPPPPNHLDGWIPPSSTSFPSSFLPSKSNDFDFDLSSSSLPTLPSSLSTSTSSLPATFSASPSVNTTPRPQSPSPTLCSHYPTFHPIITLPPPPIPANTLDWDIDPARLEARRKRVAHLYGKFCRDGKREVGAGNIGIGDNGIGREMGEKIRLEMEREMGYRGWLMEEWCAVERVQKLRMDIEG